MKYRRFGKTGLDISEIGFGAWAIGGWWGAIHDEESRQALRKALELGVNFIDTAHGYGDGHSESIIGDLLKDSRRGASERPVKVATKLPPVDGHWPPFPDDVCEKRFPRDYVRAGVETSLKRLRTEAVDCFQLHTWTRAWNDDPVCLQFLEELKKEGKVLSYGISTPEQDQNCLIDLMRKGLIDTVQVIYNLFDQEAAAGFLKEAHENNIGVIVRCALDEGSLTGKFTGETVFEKDDFRNLFFKGSRLKETVRRVEEIRKTVALHSPEDAENLASVAVRFVLRHPAVSTVITGIRNPLQAERNCSISNDPELPDDLYRELKTHLWRRYFWEWSDVY